MSGQNLGGYLGSPCPRGEGIHVYPWYWSATGGSAVTMAGGFPPETKIQPCPNCTRGGQT